MTAVGQFTGKLEEFRGREGMVWRDKAFWFDELPATGVPAGSVEAIEEKFSPETGAAVEVDGEPRWILERTSEVIHVSEDNVVTGNIVMAQIKLSLKKRRALSANGRGSFYRGS